MPEFHYKAMDAQGRMVDGILHSEDKRTLAMELQKAELFLVSAAPLEASPAAVNNESSLPDENVHPPGREGASAVLQKPSHYVVMAVVFAVCVLTGYWIYGSRSQSWFTSK